MPRVIKTYDEYEFGLSWVLEETMQRASHAIVDDAGKLWLIDPVAVDEALERALELGEPAGVLQLLDRHNRDCAQLAEQLGVPHIEVPVVGTNDYYTGGAGRVGMHPLLRAVPPGGVREYEPEHLLMGHGAGVHGPDTPAELERAHARARRDLPRVLLKLPFSGS